jgi:hypothetical protein
MEMKGKVSTRRSSQGRLVSWSIAVLVTILASAGSVFATPSENAPIWRVQFRIQTADVEDAGTDNSVRVALNPNNNTWLDYARDDFPRNNTFTYDLKLDYVATIADLQHIYLSKDGSDGLAVKSFALLVNGRTIYTQTFPGSGHWLDSSDGHLNTYVVDYTQLRQDDAWRAYTQPPPPQVIPRAEIVSRIEGLVGDFITGNKLTWDGGVRVLKVRNAPGNTLRVELYLKYERLGPNPDVYAHFDLEVRCANNQITLGVKNLHVEVYSHVYYQTLTAGLVLALDHFLNERLSKSLKGLNFTNLGVPVCPVIKVDNDGDINFSFLFNPIFPAPVLAKPATEAERGEMIADSVALLAVNVETENEIKADTETAYVLRVKSNCTEAMSVNLQVELPTLVTLADALIEVVDANGQRLLGPQFSAGEGGELRLSFSDRLEAGAQHRYRLSLRFRYAPQADLQIKARVAKEGGAAEIKSTTFFHLEDGAVKARGTFQATKAMKAAPVAQEGVKPEGQ